MSIEVIPPGATWRDLSGEEHEYGCWRVCFTLDPDDHPPRDWDGMGYGEVMYSFGYVLPEADQEAQAQELAKRLRDVPGIYEAAIKHWTGPIDERQCGCGYYLSGECVWERNVDEVKGYQCA